MEKGNFTVKEVSEVEQKSTAQIEDELLKKHEEKINESKNTVETVTEEKVQTQESTSLNEDDIITYIKDRYNKDFSSVDELFSQRESNEDLPDDVSAFLKYKKETGRGISDFMKLQTKFDDLDENQILTSYYSSTEEGLDEIDVQDLIEDKFGYDEDFDDEKDVKKKKLAKKRELSKAKKFLQEQQDQYKLPLESSSGAVSSEQMEEFERYKSYIEEAKTTQEVNKKKYDWFLKETDNVFNKDFKGFEVRLNDKTYTYKPGDASELVNKQKDVNNFLKPFIDSETGMIKDANGYHRALSIAMNPKRFASFFYEQGKADAIDNVSKKSKNIDMVRQAPQSFNKNGLKIRAVGDKSSGKGLKIKNYKRT